MGTAPFDHHASLDHILFVAQVGGRNQGTEPVSATEAGKTFHDTMGCSNCSVRHSLSPSA
jgi:hypothetical protein